MTFHRLRPMRKQTFRWLLALLSCLPCSMPAAGTQTAYRIDPDTSQAMFRVRLFWLENIHGHFTHVDGDVVPEPRSHSWVVNATIIVDSVAMSSAHVRQWLLAPAFFDAKHHPVIHFVSSPIAQAELDHGGTLTGYLTMRGITAPIHFTIAPVHCAKLAASPCKIMLHGTLERSTFGMTSDRVALSDSVDLNLSITLQREIR